MKTVNCDGRKKEIFPTEGVESWYLQLDKITNSTYELGVIFDDAMAPPINKDKQFHDIKCLKDWINDMNNENIIQLYCLKCKASGKLLGFKTRHGEPYIHYFPCDQCYGGGYLLYLDSSQLPAHFLSSSYVNLPEI